MPDPFVNQPFRLLGLGPKVQPVLDALNLPTGSFWPEVVVVTEPNPALWMEVVLAQRPQVLLLEAWGPSPELAAFTAELGQMKEHRRPRVFLVLEDLQAYCDEWVSAGWPVQVKGVPSFLLASKDQLAPEEEAEEDYQAIDPKPTYSFAPKGGLRPLGNLGADAFEGFTWKGRNFEPKEFFELISYLKEGASPLPQSQSFFLYDHQLYLRHRYHFKEMESFPGAGLNFEHVADQHDLVGENTQVFALKLKDQLLELGHFFIARRAWADPLWLKEHLLVELKTDHKVLDLFARYHLTQAGFRLGTGKGTVKLDLTRQASGFDWPEELWAIPFFEDLKEEQMEVELPPQNQMTVEDILRTRESLFRRKDTLNERHKAHEGAKLLKAQEEDIKLMARRKLELLGQLMERAVVVDPESHEMILKLGQDCLVFYEDDMVARQISRHLQGTGKILAFDIGGFSNLQGLLTYKTDHLVPFLSHGHILVTQRSKDFLLKKLDRIAEESKRQQGIKTDLAAQELFDEKEKLLEGFENLACLEAWSRCQPAFATWIPRVAEELAETARNRVALGMGGVDHDAVVVAKSGYHYARLKQLVAPMSLKGFVAQPELLASLPETEGQTVEEQQKRLAQENATRLARYFAQVAEELRSSDANLIFLDQDLSLGLPLLNHLRRSEGLQDRVWVLLLERPLTLEQMDLVLDLKTLPLYLGRHSSHLGSNWSRFF